MTGATVSFIKMDKTKAIMSAVFKYKQDGTSSFGATLDSKENIM